MKPVISTLQDKSLFGDLGYPSMKSVQEPRLPEDITENRHKNNPASVDANKKVNKALDRQRVIDAFVHFCGESWSKQIADYLEKPLNSISGRLSELKAMGVLVSAGKGRVEGCEILRLKR